jgi:O-antigen/teichoic acid export membrane protein
MAKSIHIEYLKNFFVKGNERTLRAKKNVSVSFLCKGISILISFLIVPLTLGYVGKVEYGIWMTISSIIQWFVFFDIGLGNGLRNKLAEALAENDHLKARIYISSAFFLIAGIAIFMFVGFFIVAHFVSWNSVVNTTVVSNEELFVIFLMVFFFFCLGFVSGLISSVLQAMQKYALNDILGLIAQILGLLAIFILVKTTKGTLFNLCLVYGSKTAIVMTVAASVMFLGPLKKYRPSLKFFNFKEAKPLLNLGAKFFVNQILYLIVAETSVILVVQFFGPEEVTVFNLALRYTSITSMGYMMVLTPFLSAFTEAFTKKDFVWIKKTMRKINMIWILVSVLTLIMVLGSQLFFELWVGKAFHIPISLLIVLALSSIFTNYTASYSMFLNGIGKIELQFYVLIIQATLFFPLSFCFFKMGLGLISIVIPQLLFYLISSIIMKMQYEKIIHQSARGIWLK